MFAKLQHLGIRGLPLELIKDYFNNRYQFVVFRGTESIQRIIRVGVPQGSILGPLFFLIYINDLARVSLLFRSILFADDTNLFIKHRTREGLYRIANEELGKFSRWVSHNKLTLNHNKTEYIEFIKSKPFSPNQSLVIDGKDIKRVQESKFLGIIIDSRISWRPHIQKIITKISQTIGIIGRARVFMSQPQLALLYNTMVLPHLQYCLINWGNFRTDSNCKLGKKLLTLQKCLVRIVNHAPGLSHADPLFYKQGSLKIEDLYEQSVRMFSYKLFKNALPQEIADIFPKNNHCHSTRSAKNNLFVNRSHPRSIKAIIPRCWNSLPPAMKLAPSLASFKSQSKASLLAPYSSFVCQLSQCPSCSPNEP